MSICLDCGSMTWEEYIDGVKFVYTIDKNGRIHQVYMDSYGDLVLVKCANCGSNRLARLQYTDLNLTDEEVKELAGIEEPEDRLEWLKRKGKLIEAEDDNGKVIFKIQ